MRQLLPWGFVLLGLLPAAGCGGAPQSQGAALEGERYLLAVEPPQAQGVGELVQSAAAGDEVVVVGRIGGANSWVEGMAAFLIADLGPADCDAGQAEPCPHSGDCCPGDQAAPRTLVKLVDEEGQPLGSDARQLLGVREHQTVVVRGRAERDDAGNVSVAAGALYVRAE